MSERGSDTDKDVRKGLREKDRHLKCLCLSARETVTEGERDGRTERKGERNGCRNEWTC